MSSPSTHTPSQKTTVLLWIIQGLLALVFMFAGVMKFVTPIEEMTKQVPLPGLFLRFIGLAIITVGATVVTLMTGGGAMALIPLVVALLSAFVAYSHWRLGSPKTF